MNNQELINEINKLKKEKNAVLLVHNYQRPEIYEIADYLGDSFGLAKKATETDKDIIVFCGVDFMAESAKILNPEKKVLWPNLEAKCPMAAMVNAESLSKKIEELKQYHPDLAVVSYVNSSGEVKALSDICCTSSNAVKIVESLQNKAILFVPDKNLANYVASKTDKLIIPWEGFCYVHESNFNYENLKKAKENLPDAEAIIHPECSPGVVELADYVCSTSQMIDKAKNSKAKRFFIGTENSMLNRLEDAVPGKEFYSAGNGAICLEMKKITLDDVYQSLLKEQYEVNFPEEMRVKAKKALERMLKVGTDGVKKDKIFIN